MRRRRTTAAARLGDGTRLAGRERAHEAESSRLDRGVSFGAVIVALVTLVAYANSFNGVFVFDDITHVLNAPFIRDNWSLVEHLTGSSRPGVTLSLALNHAMSGFDVWSYHLFNLSVHIAAALALYMLIQETMNTCGYPRRTMAGRLILSASAAAVWAVHPIQTESVTYIVQRGESMMGFCYLLTLLAAARGARSGRPAGWYALAAIACAAGMACKGVMVTAPLTVLLYDRVFLSHSFREAVGRRRFMYLGLCCTWVILGLVGVIGGVLFRTAADKATVGLGVQYVTTWEYARTQPMVILHYLRLMVWPRFLCLDYDWPVTHGVISIVASAALVLGALAASVAQAIRGRAVGFCCLAFFIILLPTSSIVKIQDLAVEHRMYLPSAAVIVVLMMGLDAILRSLATTVQPNHLSSGLTCLIAGAAVALCIGRTWTRNGDYASASTLWRSVVVQSPHNDRAWFNLGKSLRDEGLLDEDVKDKQVNAVLKLIFNGTNYTTGKSSKGDNPLGLLYKATRGGSGTAKKAP